MTRFLITVILPILLTLCGYITHIVHCISNDKIVFFLVGLIFFPVGIIHGIYLWF